jgi:hypothetical protein
MILDSGDILTPREVFDAVAEAGYRVDYGRVAIVGSIDSAGAKLD